jgi:flavodoxin
MINLSAPIHVIYASTGGNTEHVMEQVAKHWQAQGVDVILHRAEQTSLSVITDNKYFLLSTSTWDHGTINPFFNKLLAEMKQTDLTGKVSSFIGLGDRRYEQYYFCTGMTLLKEIWEKQNGAAIGIALTIGREPFEEIIETIVEKWANDTLPFYVEGKTS